MIIAVIRCTTMKVDRPCLSPTGLFRVGHTAANRREAEWLEDFYAVRSIDASR